MKRLILFRHAKSSWGDPDLEDLDRPLNNRGKRDAPMMGKRLAKRGVQADVIITSPAKRAKKTARLIAREIGSPKTDIHEDRRIYDAEVEDLMHVIHDIDDIFRTVLMVGHNPGFNALSYYLTGHKVDSIPTCGIFEIEFDLTSWSKVEEGSGKFLSFDFPKNQ